MGRNNNPTRGSTIRHVVRTIAAASAAVATLAAGMLVAGTADAADMRDPFERSIQNGNPGLWTNLGTLTFSNGASYLNMEQSLGVVDRVNGRNAYCIQADVLYTATTSARLLFPCSISGYTHRQQMASRTSGARVSAVCASASETILR